MEMKHTDYWGFPDNYSNGDFNNSIKVTRPCLLDGDTSVETTGSPDAPDDPGEA
jgi:hypothetical protein